MAGAFLAVAVIGVTLLLSKAQVDVIGQGDRYVALYLAQQQIESLTATVLQKQPPLPPVCPSGVNTGFDDLGAGTNATTQTAGEQAGAGLQQFTRSTTIDCMDVTDPSTPVACPAVCTCGVPCPPSTKRITVTVTPFLQTSDPVTLVTVITRHSANNF
jgi:hypothetical protein